MLKAPPQSAAKREKARVSKKDLQNQGFNLRKVKPWWLLRDNFDCVQTLLLIAQKLSAIGAMATLLGTSTHALVRDRRDRVAMTRACARGECVSVVSLPARELSIARPGAVAALGAWWWK